jgi:hypothetical protein
VTGLFLEGCGWDGTQRVLAESQPKVLPPSSRCSSTSTQQLQQQQGCKALPREHRATDVFCCRLQTLHVPAPVIWLQPKRIADIAETPA